MLVLSFTIMEYDMGHQEPQRSGILLALLQQNRTLVELSQILFNTICKKQSFFFHEEGECLKCLRIGKVGFVSACIFLLLPNWQIPTTIGKLLKQFQCNPNLPVNYVFLVSSGANFFFDNTSYFVIYFTQKDLQ